MTIEQVIDKYFACLNSDDFVSFRELWHHDAEFKAVGGRPRVGVDEIVLFYSRLFAPWRQHDDKPTRLLVAGTVATVEVVFTGTTGDGRTVTFDAVDVIDIEEGRIKRLTNWYDIAYVRRLLSPPDAEPIAAAG
jgi:ketosteroid isomerase-like protein